MFLPLNDYKSTVINFMFLPLNDYKSIIINFMFLPLDDYKSTVINFMFLPLNDYKSTIIIFMLLPLIFGLNIIAECCLQIQTKKFYFQKYVNNTREFDHGKNSCVLSEILKNKSYEEPLPPPPSQVQHLAEKIQSQLINISFGILYIYLTSDIN